MGVLLGTCSVDSISDSDKAVDSSAIDVQLNCDPGDDGILVATENGYAHVQEQARRILSKSLHENVDPKDFWELFELFDGQPGYSASERKIVYSLLYDYTRFINSPAGYGSRPREARTSEYTDTFPVLLSALLGVFEQVDVAQRTPELLEKLTEAFDQGFQLGAGLMRGQPVPWSFDLESENRLFQMGFGAGATCRVVGQPVHSSATIPATELLTAQDVMAEALYGPLGLYELGKLGDHSVYDAAMSPVEALSPIYGELYAERIFARYQEMLTAGTIASDEEFSIYEHGGGDGQLARDILSYAAQQATQNELWKQFYQNLHYYGVEIATSAYEEQKRLENEFPGKFSALLGDAVHFKPEKKGKGIVISSEMINSFPLHCVAYQNEEWKMVSEIPCLAFRSEGERQVFLDRYFPETGQVVREQSKAILADYLGADPDHVMALCLTKESFYSLEVQLAAMKDQDVETFAQRWEDLRKALCLVRVATDLKDYPLTLSYQQRHSYMRAGREDELRWINPDLDSYLENVAQNYFEPGAGAFMTTDVTATVYYENGEVNQILKLQRQAGGGHEIDEEISMDEFGRYIFYAPLPEEQIKETLADNGVSRVTIRPRQELWVYHKQLSQEEMMSLYQHYCEREIQQGKKTMSFSDYEATLLNTGEEALFDKLVFASF